MQKKEIKYPFKPKTTKNMVAGQFWGIPLKNGMFACGRVLQLPWNSPYPGFSRSRILFFVGLMDWLGKEPPTFDAIAGHKILEEGTAHIRIILKNDEGAYGEGILGFRPLELDGIEPQPRLESAAGTRLFKGFEFFREASEKECESGTYRTASVWGFDVIGIYAEEYYVRGLLKP